MTRYPDAPASEKGSTVETGNWFQDYARDQLEKHWGISPKSYHSPEYQLEKGEGRYAEFKHDPHTKWDHLAIEVSERRDLQSTWVPSGIFARSLPPFYIQGDKNEIWHFSSEMLKMWAEKKLGIAWSHGQLLDPNNLVQEYNGTMKRFFLEYDDAARIGGVRII